MECSRCHTKLPDDAVYCSACGERNGQELERDDYAYAAFISYRHLPRDTVVAKRVQDALEAFRLPKGLACLQGFQSGQRLGKCFRDEDELAASHSLPESIKEALARSHSLVVVCSPETRESLWVRREIEMFIQLHGRDRIICVLAAGSSSESIPEILRYRFMPDIDGEMRKMPAEPLAADLRSGASVSRRAELLRVIAAVAGCGYDDLRQREKARRRHRIAALATALIAILAIMTYLGVAAYSSSQDALAEESKLLAAKSQEQFARGERMQAIQTALDALPIDDSLFSRPFVPEAQAALELALGANQSKIQVWRPNGTIDSNGEVLAYELSRFDTCGVSLSDDGVIDVFDVFTGVCIKKLNIHAFEDVPADIAEGEWRLAPAGNRHLLIAHCGLEGLFGCIDMVTGSIVWQRPGLTVNVLEVSEDGSQCVVGTVTSDNTMAMALIDITSGEIAASMETGQNAFSAELGFYPCSFNEISHEAAVGAGEFIVLFNFDTASCDLVSLGMTLIYSVCAKENTIIAASSDRSSQDDVFAHPYMLAAAVEQSGGLVPVWHVEGVYSWLLTGSQQEAYPHEGEPTALPVQSGSGDAIACSVGDTLRVVELETGADLTNEHFGSTIVGMGALPHEDGDFLVLVLAEGALDGRFMGMNPAFHGETYSMSIPYQIESACVRQVADGHVVVLMHPVDQPNRLLSYHLDGSDPFPTGLALDELIALANEELGRG